MFTTKLYFKKIFYLSFIILIFTNILSFASDTLDYIQKIEKAYKNIKDMKGNFVQKNYIKDLKKSNIYHGDFFIKSEKIKLQYNGKHQQTIYITNSEIFIYQPKQKQVIKRNFDKKTFGQIPIILLSDLGNIKDKFDITTKYENILNLKPKLQMGNIDSIEIFVSDNEIFPIQTLFITDKSFNTTEISFLSVKINSNIEDKIFKHVIQKDINIPQ